MVFLTAIATILAGNNSQILICRITEKWVRVPDRQYRRLFQVHNISLVDPSRSLVSKIYNQLYFPWFLARRESEPRWESR